MAEAVSIKAGLIGAGIQASGSPAIHMAEAKALGFDLTYTLHDLDQVDGGPEALPEVLSRAEGEGYAGVNITYPVKQAVIPLLDSLSPDARALGAVNTVVFSNGRRIGHNTDWRGFADNLRRGLPGVTLDRVVQLGAGGAGSAVAYGLLSLGAGQITVFDTDQDRAHAMAQALGEDRVKVGGNLAGAVAAADGVVNCTPVGMAKYPGSPLPPALLRPSLWVADIVYFPLETALLAAARKIGCRTLDGGGMAVLQAAEAFRLFTGQTPDIDRMLARFIAEKTEKTGA